MNHPVRTRPDPDEVRARILEVAEQHCRRIGYHKTSVADIASELGMSRANVYRFFPSRDAINESICRRVVSEVADVAIAIARMDAPALEKLDRLLTAVHHHNKTKLIVRAELLGRDGEIDRLQQRVDADRVCDWGDGVQWPNERKPIFFMLLRRGVMRSVAALVTRKNSAGRGRRADFAP